MKTTRLRQRGDWSAKPKPDFYLVASGLAEAVYKLKALRSFGPNFENGLDIGEVLNQCDIFGAACCSFLRSPASSFAVL